MKNEHRGDGLCKNILFCVAILVAWQGEKDLFLCVKWPFFCVWADHSGPFFSLVSFIKSKSALTAAVGGASGVLKSLPFSLRETWGNTKQNKRATPRTKVEKTKLVSQI